MKVKHAQFRACAGEQRMIARATPCLDDQRRKHLHRNGAPQKDQKDITHPTDTSEGPLAQAPACSQQALENPLGDPHKLHPQDAEAEVWSLDTPHPLWGMDFINKKL
uniref:Uncharacterized protein n=1 Tax=Romanomermis culicivorax TaxID=13658 RepID=A0A915IYH9_ROMCU